MSDQPHLPTTPPSQVSMNFAQLLQQGIALCQQLSGEVWSDYNEHDPGVTILEQLCYAMTDIGYRSDFRVADILAETPLADQPGNTTLYTGDQVLSCNPLTLNDYRKLLIDDGLTAKWSNFKNAWIQPTRKAVKTGGLYDIVVEVYEPEREADGSTLLEQIRSSFDCHRNLGEDLQSVQLLTLLEVTPSGVVEVAVGADPNVVLANILFSIQDMLVPTVRIDSVGHLLQQGVAPEQIYQGPLLRTGVIDDSCLHPKRTQLSLADVGNVILLVDGVQSVSQLQVAAGGVELTNTVEVNIKAGQVPRLMPSIYSGSVSSSFRMTRQGATLLTDPGEVARLLSALREQAAGTQYYAADQNLWQKYTTLEKGKSRAIAHYYSLQRQFPQTYGIGAYGLAEGQPLNQMAVQGSIARQAQAQQLKAYLLFFEQLLSDCQKQLASAGLLFSLDDSLQQSYFCQSLVEPVDGPPDMVPLLRAEAPKPPDPPLPPIPDVERFLVYVYDHDAQGTALLRSREYDSQGAAERAAERMLNAGSQVSSYRVRRLPGDQYQVLLEDKEAPAFGCQRFATWAEADAEVVRLALFMAELEHDPRLRSQYLQIESRGHMHLRLLDDAGAVLLSADQLTSSGRELRRQAMIDSGLHRELYAIASHGNGRRWRVRLLDRQHRTIAEGWQDHASHADAERAAAAMVALFQRLCRDPAQQDKHFQYVPPRSSEPVPPDQKPDDDSVVASYIRRLLQLVASLDPYAARRNRFLDHLLARFNERFDDITLRQLDVRQESQKAAFELELIGWKSIFLRQYVRLTQDVMTGNGLGTGRGKGAYAGDQRPGTPVSTRSGLAARMAVLLGIPDRTSDFPLSYYEDDAGPQDADAPPVLMDRSNGFLFASDEPAILRRLLRDGCHASAYTIRRETDGTSTADDATDASESNDAGSDKDGSHAVYFGWSDSGKQAPMVVYRARSHARAERAIARLTAYLRRFTASNATLHSGEEFYVIEHVLLRPLPVLPKTAVETTDETAADAADNNAQGMLNEAAGDAGKQLDSIAAHGVPDEAFYMYRVSAIFPDSPARFQDPAFRSFAQQTAEENCPAHLQVQCLWWNRRKMRQFKVLYARWEQLRKAGDSQDLQQVVLQLAQLIAGLVPAVPANDALAGAA